MRIKMKYQIRKKYIMKKIREKFLQKQNKR